MSMVRSPRSGGPTLNCATPRLPSKKTSIPMSVRTAGYRAAVCSFNGTEFRNGDFVASGSQVLRCSYGVWVDAGSTIDDRSP